MNGLNRRKVTSLWCSSKGVQLLFNSSHFSKIKGKAGTPSTSSPHHPPRQISLCTPYPQCSLAVSGKVTHIRVNTRSPNHILHPISAHPFGALLLLPIPSFFFPSFLYLRHLLLPGPFPFCFSVDPGPTMLAKQTIKIKPLLNSIHSPLPSSLRPVPLRTHGSFPGISIHGLHLLSPTYLKPTAIWLSSCHSTGTALAKFTNNFPDPLGTCQSSAYLTTAVSHSTSSFWKFLPSLAYMLLLHLSFLSIAQLSALGFAHRLLFLNDCHILELGRMHMMGDASSVFSFSLVR